MVEQFQQHRIRGLAWPPIALLVAEQGLAGANRAITSCRGKFLRGCLASSCLASSSWLNRLRGYLINWIFSGWHNAGSNNWRYGLALQQQGAISQYPGLPIGFQHQSGGDVHHHRRSAQQGGRGQLLAPP